MFKGIIEYEDFDGNKVNEEVCLNLTRVEVIDLEGNYEGTMSATLKSMLNEDNELIAPIHEVLKVFGDIVRAAYGVRSEDGKKFIKSAEKTREFAGSAVYDELLMRMVTVPGFAGEVMNAIMPKHE